MSLAELAVESLIDGCLLEGVAAEVAARALIRACDRQARAALAVIARDEASHATLAWDVVHWCCERGGNPVRRALAATLQKAPTSVTPPEIPDALADALADHGWLGVGVWEEVFRDTAAAVTARVAALSGIKVVTIDQSPSPSASVRCAKIRATEGRRQVR